MKIISIIGCRGGKRLPPASGDVGNFIQDEAEMLRLQYYVFYSKFIPPSRGKIHAVMELMHGGDKHNGMYTKVQDRGY